MTKSEILKLARAAENATETLLDAMGEFYDDHSDEWQDSDAGEDFNSARDAVEDCFNSLAEIAGGNSI